MAVLQPQHTLTLNKKNMPIINEEDVFGLFDALYKNGHAKLSDHFVNNPKTKEPCQKK